MSVVGNLRRGRFLTLAIGTLASLAILASLAPGASARYGDKYALAPAEGAALPGPTSFWAGTCDLALAPAPEVPIGGGVGARSSQVMTAIDLFSPVFSPAPVVPEDCVDSGVTAGFPTAEAPWTTPPGWRLPAVAQAGARPDATATFTFSRDFEGESEALGAMPSGSTRDIHVALPPGVVGDPTAVPACPNPDFAQVPPTCSPRTQVGVVLLVLNATLSTSLQVEPVYNLEPLPGRTAEFGIPEAAGLTAIRITGKARTDADFGISTAVERLPTGMPLLAQSLTFWGVPWAAAHDAFRPPASYGEPLTRAGLEPDEQVHYEPGWGPIEPFFTNPTSCPGQSPVTKLWLDSWQHPASTLADGEPDLADPHWVRAGSAAPPVSDCGKLASHFKPGLTFQPQSHIADSPSAYDVDLSVPQNNKPPLGVATDPSVTGAPAYWRSEAGLATAHLKDTTVTLPEGVTVNPAGASGLAACSEAQIGLTTTSGAAPNPIRFDNAKPSCPDGSKIGTVEIETPLLEETLEGDVYIARQEANPFHSLLALYLVVEDPRRGLIVKLAGKTTPDPVTGRITATFTDNPQLPFTHLRLHLKGGAAAPLANPPTCGRFTTSGSLTPWSGQAPAVTSDSFSIDQGPAGVCGNTPATEPFDLGFAAGTTNPLAGASSPFTLRVTRPDGAQTIGHVDATMPPGLSAVLAGVPYCPEAGIAQAEARGKPGDGRLEEARPSCPAASQVGTTTIGAGAGPAPYHVSGKVYLAGPYRGAPLSLVFVVPAVAGPFDLGVQVVRVPLQVDPRTARITARSDAIPTILQGIPLRIRDIRVDIDRPAFTRNPTSCDVLAVDGRVYGSGGGVANLANRFQVGGCRGLGFHPRLKLRLKGATGRTGHPALKAVVTARPGEANIRRAQVNLPHGEFLDQGNIDKACTKPVLLAGRCPKSSVYGRAKAWTPLLAHPLEGFVYLVGGYGYKLPALVAELNGQVRILLVGKVDSGKNHGIRTTFEVVPDAPISRFVLKMKGGRKYGLLENSENLCKASKRKRAAIVRLLGHDNGRADQFPLVGNSCHKHRKARRRGHLGRRRRRR